MSLTSAILSFLLITPFALGAMVLTRNRTTRERLLFQAIRQIWRPREGETRRWGFALLGFFYAFMFLAMEIGIHM